jgi:hypothetical protein
MTNYGFDLDGTLTRPFLRDLANDLFEAGHNIYVITGGLSDTGEWTHEARVKYLLQLGVQYTEIVRCIAPNWEQIAEIKGRECAARKITVMLDDMPVFCQGIRTWSPATVTLLVL